MRGKGEIGLKTSCEEADINQVVQQVNQGEGASIDWKAGPRIDRKIALHGPVCSKESYGGVHPTQMIIGCSKCMVEQAV